VAYIEDYQVIDGIFDHLTPTSGADGSPPSHVSGQAVLAATETAPDYLS
jgi:hypothetical protein